MSNISRLTALPPFLAEVTRLTGKQMSMQFMRACSDQRGQVFRKGHDGNGPNWAVVQDQM